MVKIVIVRGAFPTAVAADLHARRVIALLRTKYGHKVIVHKVPLRETPFGIVRDSLPQEAVEQLKKEELVLPRLQRISRKHNAFAFAFNVHGTEWIEPTDSPSKFQIDEHSHPLYFLEQSAIQFVSDPNHPRAYVVGLPAHFVDIKGKAGAKQGEKAMAVKALVFPQKVRKEDEWNALRNASLRQLKVYTGLADHLHTQVAPASAKKFPEQERFLSPIISERVAQRIHQIVTRKSQEKRTA